MCQAKTEQTPTGVIEKLRQVNNSFLAPNNQDLLGLKGRAATTGKAPKASALPRFWVSLSSYKKQ